MFEFKLPDLGEGVHEGQIVSVLVKEGAPIKEYEPMLEVETDKAAVEIPAPRTGIVSKLLCAPGQQVKVGQVLVVIDDSGGAGTGAPAAAAAPAKAAAPAAAAARSAPSASPARPAATDGGRSTTPTPSRPSVPTPSRAEPAVARSGTAEGGRATAGEGGRGTVGDGGRATGAAPIAATATVAREGPVPAAPVVRKLARELGVDLNLIGGSGPGGRVLREDVEKASMGGRGGGVSLRGDGAAGAPAVSVSPGELPDFSQYGPIRREPVSQIRKTIARQMTRAWLNVPRVTHGDEADITEMERNRKSYNDGLREGQAKLTMTAIVMKAAAHALRRFPQLNATYDAANEEIIHKDFIHIGVAVDTPRGLVVPVVRDVDRKPLPQVAAELNQVAERTRTGKFEIADLRGASFTVTNVGALGGTFSTPMVNFPEMGILALAKSTWMARVTPDKQIVPRLILPMSLSFDHRLVDGADSARFCREVIGALENPLRLIAM